MFVIISMFLRPSVAKELQRVLYLIFGVRQVDSKRFYTF